MASEGQWNPLRELLTVQKRMNSLFDSALGKTDFEAHEGIDTWAPISDVFETSEALVLCLELPGLDQEQIDIRIDGDELVVAGEREIEREQPGDQFHRVERSYGKFARRFHLPSNVDRGAVAATYRDGVLRIQLPKTGDGPSPTVRVAIE